MSGEKFSDQEEDDLLITPEPSSQSSSSSKTRRPRRKWVVEPLVALYVISGLPLGSIRTQFMYQKIEESMGIQPNNFSTDSCKVNLSDPAYILQQKAQAEAANWSMYLSLASFLPSIIMTCLFGILSDNYGRRFAFILPPLGSILSTLADIAVIRFKLPLPYLFLETIEYFFGGMMTLIMASFAYIADTCEPEKRAFRMTVVDVMMMSMAAVGELVVGYLIKAQGFEPPLYYVIIGKVFVLLYAIFFIPETIQSAQDDHDSSSDDPEALKKSNKGPNPVVLFFEKLKIGLMLFVKDNGTGRQWKLLILLASYLVAETFSTYRVLTLYEMNSPLCWHSVLIGYFGAATMGIKSVVTLIASYGLRRCNVDEAWITVIARALSVVEYVYLAFVASTAMMFFAPVIGSLSFLAIPMTRAIMSKMVENDKQGALFGVMTSGGTIMGLISTLSVNKVYAATLLFYRGFVFLFAAGILSISLTLVLVYIGFSTGFGMLNCWKRPTKLSVQSADWRRRR